VTEKAVLPAPLKPFGADTLEILLLGVVFKEMWVFRVVRLQRALVNAFLVTNS
jgi:hypothetical protein